MKAKRIIAALAVLLALSGLGAFAQGKGALTVQCNMSGASVYADGRLIGNTSPNFSMILPAKTYAIKVSKPGFQDFTQTVNLTSAGLTIKVDLVAIGAVTQPKPVTPPPATTLTMTVNANVAGAEVLVNGNVVGKAPLNIQLAPGTYALQVRAQGYNTYTQNVNLMMNMQVNAVLQAVQATLSVNANVAGADVYLNGNPVGKTPLSLQVVPGSYSVTVKAAGYNDFSQGVIVSGNAQVNATLAPIQATLSINANVAGADVFINGNPVGKAPMSIQLVPGSYAVTVRAAGFNDFSQTVLVSGNAQVNASLVASTYPVNIDSNIRGAQVFINGNLSGQTPMTTSLPAGSYALSVRLAGYGDFNTQISVNGPQSVSAVLASVMAGWRVNVPANILYKDTGRDQKDAPQGQLIIFIDGNRQKDDSGQVLAGKHAVRVVSGALMFDTTIDFQAGKTYTLEPFVGLNVK